MNTDHGEKYVFAIAILSMFGVAVSGYLGFPTLVDVFKDFFIGATGCLYGLLKGSKGGA